MIESELRPMRGMKLPSTFDRCGCNCSLSVPLCRNRKGNVMRGVEIPPARPVRGAWKGHPAAPATYRPRVGNGLRPEPEMSSAGPIGCRHRHLDSPFLGRSKAAQSVGQADYCRGAEKNMDNSHRDSPATPWCRRRPWSVQRHPDRCTIADFPPSVHRSIAPWRRRAGRRQL